MPPGPPLSSPMSRAGNKNSPTTFSLTQHTDLHPTQGNTSTLLPFHHQFVYFFILQNQSSDREAILPCVYLHHYQQITIFPYKDCTFE